MVTVRLLRLTAVLAVLVAASIFSAQALAGGTKPPVKPAAVDPAVSVYVEQVPTAKGAAAANASRPGSASTGGGSGLSTGIVALLVLLVGGTAGGLLILRRRGHRVPARD